MIVRTTPSADASFARCSATSRLGTTRDGNSINSDGASNSSGRSEIREPPSLANAPGRFSPQSPMLAVTAADTAPRQTMIRPTRLATALRSSLGKLGRWYISVCGKPSVVISATVS